MSDDSIHAIEQRIAMAMRCDQYRLRRQLQVLSKLTEPSPKFDEFRHQLETSVALRQARSDSIPRCEYPEALPVSGQRDAIVQMIAQHPVIVVCGETGSGKSTQLPKMCLDAGLGRSGMIGHTQPRRIAARSIAMRVAEELGTQVGDLVGFKIRFADQTSPRSLIKMMTDGILLAETQSDRFLDQYDAIILDEAHERSLNIDFLLGILHRLLTQRSDLRLIITSATIDAERFANHFGDPGKPAPIIHVQGRGFPVDIQYLSNSEASGRDDESAGLGLAQHVAAGVDRAWSQGPGDTLIFLPTERDIREISRHLSGHFRRQGLENRVDILPLYARQPASQQQKIFQGSGRYRVVLATNVAESSLTVPGIRYVVDSGTARISRYSPRTKVQRLPIEDISRASADQRAGRCGRVGPGVCIRLYDEDDFQSREHFTTPEIRRTSLAAVILQTKMMHLGSIEEFPFLDAPRPESIREGYRTLHELGAVDQDQQLTGIGRVLGTLPVDPRVGRMIIEAEQRGCLPEVLVIAAALEVQDIRQRPPDRQQAADSAHARFVDQRSDFLSYLRLWRFCRKLQEDLSRNQFARACQTNFLGLNRVREWIDVHRQLKALVPQLRQQLERQSLRNQQAGAAQQTGASRNRKRSPNLRRNDANQVPLSDIRATAASVPDEATVDESLYAAIHQSLLAGLLSGVAMASEAHQYTGIGGQKFFLWPGSGVFAHKPKWIVAGELVETSKRYARNVAWIDPNWLEPLAEHLVRRSFSDPFWSTKSQSAFCYERVTLFGLPIVVKRRKPLAPIDPETARRMLIEEGLVAGQLESQAGFYRHNQALRETIANLAHKTRRREFVVDDYLVEHFYHRNLPSDVIDRASLEAYDKKLVTPAWSARCQTEADVIAWSQQPPLASKSGDTFDDESSAASTLYLKPDDLLPTAEPQLDVDAFPDHLQIGPTQLPLAYHFDPSAEDDGVTLTVPQVALGQVSDDLLGWLVPGMIENKIVAMIKALPKRIRRNLVPAADSARKVLDRLGDQIGKTPFMSTICQHLSELAEMPIEPSDFASDKLPESAGFYIRITDDQGTELARGRDLQQLRQSLAIDADDPESESAGIIDMPSDVLQLDDQVDFSQIDQLPVSVQRQRGGVCVTLYPALVDQGQSVHVRLLDNQAGAERQTRIGLVRMFAVAERAEINKQVRWLPGVDRAGVQMASLYPGKKFKQGLADMIAHLAFVDGQPVVRSQPEFEDRRKNRGERIAVATQELAKLLTPMAENYHGVALAIDQCRTGHLAYAGDDIKQQIAHLFGDEFWIGTPLKYLVHYPRYLKAIVQRLEKLRSNQGKDRQAFDTIQPYWDDYRNRRQQSQADQATLDEYRWMIEELRVSLFAQTLGTAGKVSPQRLDKLRAKL